VDHPAEAPWPTERPAAYEDFKTLYLSLDPELADSGAMVERLIQHNSFDWLNQLLEETLGEEPIDGRAINTDTAVVTVPQPAQHTPRTTELEAA